MAGTKYLGEWETRAAKIADHAVRANAVLCWSDVWNLPYAGVSSNSPSNLFELYRPRMTEGGLLMIGELTLEALAKAERVGGFMSMFDVVRIDALSTDELRAILQRYAAGLRFGATDATLQRVTELCDQFLPATVGPGQPLRLLERVRHYADEKAAKGEPEPMGPEFVEKVFSIYSGLPRFVVDANSTVRVNDIGRWFHDRVMGQEAAVDAVVESIVLFKAAINDPGRPLGTFLFAGPTGVGKTELAKALATYLFGSERRLLRFDLSEFASYQSYRQLIGDAETGGTSASLVDPVREQPFQVVLFDELEKGHANIQDLLLQILDEGRLTDASGKVVDFRKTFIIATTNVGSEAASRKPAGFGNPGDANDGDARLREGLEAYFRPEFLNRFQRVVPFHALRREDVERIVRKEISLVLARRGIGARELAVEPSDALITRISNEGYDVRYGARALKRQVQRQIVMPIATLLAERNPTPGSMLKLDVRSVNVPESGGATSVRVLSTEQSATHAKASRAVRNPSGEPVTRPAMLDALKATRRRIVSIRKALDVDGFGQRLEELEAQRLAPDLWADASHANAVLAELDLADSIARRIEDLHDTLSEISEPFHPDCSRETLVRTIARQRDLMARIEVAQRELVVLGADGRSGAMLELNPLGNGEAPRDRLYEIYRHWAIERGHSITMLREPMSADEPVQFGISGDYCYGYLRRESGIHRFRPRDAAAGTVRVRVAAVVAERCEPVFENRVALKKRGHYGGRVRSRSVVSEPCRLILQNDASLEDNRDLAAWYAASWVRRPVDVDENVRRYDDEPLLVKDLLTGQSFNRGDWLKPTGFHKLLCERVDAGMAAGSIS